MYKRFGIYTNDFSIDVLVEVSTDYTIGIEIPLNEITDFTNTIVNDWLKQNLQCLTEDDIFESDLKHMNYKPNGYLGQIEDLEIQYKLRSFVEEYQY